MSETRGVGWVWPQQAGRVPILSLTGSGVFGANVSHCRPVSTSTADSRMATTSARDWLEPAAMVGAT